MRPIASALCGLLLSSCAARQPWSEAVGSHPEVFVDVLPRSAEVRLDGKLIGRGPIAVRLGDGPGMLEVAAPGFEKDTRLLDPRTQGGERLGVALRPDGFGEGRKVSADEPAGLVAASSALLRRGSAVEAAEYAERAVELAPQAAAAHRALGLALVKLPPTRANRIRAARELSAYVAAAPEGPERAELARLVEELRGDISVPAPVSK